MVDFLKILRKGKVYEKLLKYGLFLKNLLPYLKAIHSANG